MTAVIRLAEDLRMVLTWRNRVHDTNDIGKVRSTNHTNDDDSSNNKNDSKIRGGKKGDSSGNASKSDILC